MTPGFPVIREESISLGGRNFILNLTSYPWKEMYKKNSKSYIF
jgi:hypothetical protein